jgi:hypothetical protein
MRWSYVPSTLNSIWDDVMTSHGCSCDYWQCMRYSWCYNVLHKRSEHMGWGLQWGRIKQKRIGRCRRGWMVVHHDSGIIRTNWNAQLSWALQSFGWVIYCMVTIHIMDPYHGWNLFQEFSYSVPPLQYFTLPHRYWQTPKDS